MPASVLVAAGPECAVGSYMYEKTDSFNTNMHVETSHNQYLQTVVFRTDKFGEEEISHYWRWNSH